LPRQAKFARGRHVTDEGGGRDAGGARKVAFAAEAHAVLPVAVERRDGALARRQRVGPLSEARAAPRLPDVTADRAEHVRDRLPAQARVGLPALAADPARAGADLAR